MRLHGEIEILSVALPPYFVVPLLLTSPWDMDTHCPPRPFPLPSRIKLDGTSCNIFLITRVNLDGRASGVTNHLNSNYRKPEDLDISAESVV